MAKGSSLDRRIRAGIEAQKKTAPASDAVSELDSLWLNLEKLQEDTGRVLIFEEEVKAYIVDQRSEIASRKKIRFWVTMLTLGIIGAMLGLLIFVLFCPRSPLRFSSYLSDTHFISDTYFKVALLIAPLTVIVTLSALLIRGAFLMPSKDDYAGLPPQAKDIVDTLRSLIRVA